MNRSTGNSGIPASREHSLFRRRLMIAVKCNGGRMAAEGTEHSIDVERSADGDSTFSSSAPLRNLCGLIDCPVSIDSAGNEFCWCRVIDARDVGD